jgi:hypothetical protein
LSSYLKLFMKICLYRRTFIELLGILSIQDLLVNGRNSHDIEKKFKNFIFKEKEKTFKEKSSLFV